MSEMFACPGVPSSETFEGLPRHEGVPAEDFYEVKGKRSYRCKVCQRHAQRKYERKYETQVRARKATWARERRWASILVLDGDGGTRPFTDDDFDAAWLEQGSACKICGREFETMPHVDHDHRTHLFRGLLCLACNTALGQFQDDPERIRRAIDYLGGQADM